MLETLLFAASVLLTLGFVGYRACRVYARRKIAHELIEKYVGPHPKHPVFGTIKGFGGGWEFYAALPTAGLRASAVQFILDDDPNAIHIANYELLCAKWPATWPRIFDALQRVMEDYGAMEALSTSEFRLSVDIPDEPFTEGTEWSVGLESLSGGGSYNVQMRGWTEIVQRGAVF